MAWVGSDQHKTQAQQALDLANETRLAKAKLFRDLNDKQVTLQEAMDHWSVRNMAVGDFFEKRRRWGSLRTSRLIRSVPVGYSVQMKNLTERQKRKILNATD